MSNKLNNTLNLKDLKCTNKALQDIQNFTNTLSGRERQLIILMTRETTFCDRAGQRLLDKIDLQTLISRGYLILKEDSKVISLHSAIVDTSAPVSSDVIDPALNFIAGNI